MSVSFISVSEVDVSWIAGFDSWLGQRFVMQLSKDKANWENKEQVECNEGSSYSGFKTRISDLEQSSSYCLRMYAQNTHGKSNFTSEICFITGINGTCPYFFQTLLYDFLLSCYLFFFLSNYHV